ncbi:MAG TPA: magnesium chelatase domain-containing protein [Trueperaceae bacterium]
MSARHGGVGIACAAVRNAGPPFPVSRIVVNLVAANVRKEVADFDLPIALALLAAQGMTAEGTLEGTVASGKLALDVTVFPVRGVIVPLTDAAETEVEGLEESGVEDLHWAVEFLQSHRFTDDERLLMDRRAPEGRTRRSPQSSTSHATPTTECWERCGAGRH